jgi:anti-anti-sigma factor
MTSSSSSGQFPGGDARQAQAGGAGALGFALRAVDSPTHGPPTPPARGAATVELVLSGRIYADVAPQLREQLGRAVEDGLKCLVVDARELVQIDSAGLNEFVQLLKKLRPNGGKIAFFGLNANVRRVFDITKLSTVMSVFATREDAVRSCA